VDLSPGLSIRWLVLFLVDRTECVPLSLMGATSLTSPHPNRKPRHQPALWDCVWPRNGRHHLRLEPNRLHRLAAHDPLVGSSPCLCRLRGAVLYYATDPILHQRTVSPLFPRPVLISNRRPGTYLAYMPIGGRTPYDRFGRTYNVTRILDSTGRQFSLSNYEAYSALYLPGPYAMNYLLAFALSTALLVHTSLYHSSTVYHGIKRVQTEEEDVHAKLMRSDPEVSDTWYASIFVVFFAMSIVAIAVWRTDFPVWALALSVLVAALYLIPCGFLFAFTGQEISINVLAETIPGVLWNGRPLANMVRATFLFSIVGTRNKDGKTTDKLVNMVIVLFFLRNCYVS